MSKRLKRCRSGSLDWYADRAEFRPGPSTVKELFNWAPRVAEVMADSRQSFLALLMQFSFRLHSQYSGKFTAESLFTKLGLALSQHTDVCNGRNWLIGTGIEKKPCALLVGLAHDDQTMPEHIFKEFDDMIHPGTRNRLNSFEAPPAADAEVRAASFVKMAAELDSATAFPHDHVAPCARHPGDGCSIQVLETRDGELSI